MKRAQLPDHLEAIANSPRIRPWLGGDGEVKAGDTWARTVALQWPEGGVVFMHQGKGVYDAHLVFDRPTDVLAKCKQALSYLFGIGAKEVIATVPKGYWHVARIAKAAGMQRRGKLYRLTAQEFKHKE